MPVELEKSQTIANLVHNRLTEGKVDPAFLNRILFENIYYKYGYLKSILNNFRGPTDKSFIVHKNLSPGSPNKVQFSIQKNFDPKLEGRFYKNNLELHTQEMEQYPFEMRIIDRSQGGKIEIAEGVDEEARAKLFVTDYALMVAQLKESIKQAIEIREIGAFIKNYTWKGVNGGMPLACRCHVGAGEIAKKYKYNKGENWATQVIKAMPKNTAEGGIQEDHSMSVKHIRELRAKARAYGSFINAGSTYGQATDPTKEQIYVLFISSQAATALKADPEFKNQFSQSNNVFLDSSKLYDPINYNNCLGKIENVYVYECEYLDNLNLIAPHAGFPEALSVSLFMGAGALAEFTKFIKILKRYDGKSLVLSEVGYYSNVEPIRWPNRFLPFFHEKDEEGALIANYPMAERVKIVTEGTLEENATLDYTMPEFGLIISLTVNQKIKDWTGEEG